MKKIEPIYSWHENIKTAVCTVTDKNDNKFEGFAYCHPDDYDFANEKTGCTIAHMRAEIKSYQFYRNHELKPALAALRQLYYTMNQSKSFNPDSYEAKMLMRHINQKLNDIEATNELIEELRKNIKDFIDQKEIFYQKIRSKRRVEDKLKQLESIEN